MTPRPETREELLKRQKDDIAWIRKHFNMLPQIDTLTTPSHGLHLRLVWTFRRMSDDSTFDVVKFLHIDRHPYVSAVTDDRLRK